MKGQRGVLNAALPVIHGINIALIVLLLQVEGQRVTDAPRLLNAIVRSVILAICGPHLLVSLEGRREASNFAIHLFSLNLVLRNRRIVKRPEGVAHLVIVEEGLFNVREGIVNDGGLELMKEEGAVLLEQRGPLIRQQEAKRFIFIFAAQGCAAAA